MKPPTSGRRLFLVIIHDQTWRTRIAIWVMTHHPNHCRLCPPHITRHDTTRHPRQENRVMCGSLRHNATRQNRALSQISSIVRSLTTRPDFCLVVSCRRPPHITRFFCRELSRRVMSCNVRWALCVLNQ